MVKLPHDRKRPRYCRDSRILSGTLAENFVSLAGIDESPIRMDDSPLGIFPFGLQMEESCATLLFCVFNFDILGEFSTSIWGLIF